MNRRSTRVYSSVFATILLITAAIRADDSVQPKHVLMDEQALTEQQARAVQQAWADHLGVDAVFENSVGMQLCVIPPGKFPMGDTSRKIGVVTHSQPFFISKHEVTQQDWQQVMGSADSTPEADAGDRLPACKINHAEAAEFCRKLTQLEREAGKLPEGYEYRLPTDAEWEYACRAGTLTATHFGDKLSSTQANFDGRRPYKGAAIGPTLENTVEVGSYPANAWGLHDMHGNIGEWCLDYYHRSAKAGVDPVQLEPAPDRHKTHRLIRGGRFKGPASYCRSANRYFQRQQARTQFLGFRPVLSKLHLGES